MRRVLNIITALATALVLLSGSIAMPILIRPFYYAHIEPLNLEEKSGLTSEEIVQAYDEVLDYCTGKSESFSAGVLKFSEDGASHFADCRKLFILDFEIFGASAAVLAVCAVLRRRIRSERRTGRGPAFFGAVGMSAALCITGALAALNFDKAFVVFHSIFFPGKTNWVFYTDADPVILIMPEVFFRNCALLILGTLVAASAAIIVADLKKKN